MSRFPRKLKVAGTVFGRFSNSPITRVKWRSSCGGAPQALIPYRGFNMKIQKCDNCGAAMANTNKCTKCGEILPEDQRHSAKKSGEKPLSETIFTAVVMVAFAWGFYWYFGGDDSSSTYKSPSRPTVTAGQMDAWAYIQLAVEARLKNPGSASFPFGGHRDVIDLGGGRYSVSSYVNAKNSFSATVRTRFSATIRRVEGGWRVEAISISQ